MPYAPDERVAIGAKTNTNIFSYHFPWTSTGRRPLETFSLYLPLSLSLSRTLSIKRNIYAFSV